MSEEQSATLHPGSFLGILFLGCAFTLIALLPLDLTTGGVPMPDLAFVLIAAMVIRRPAQIPLISVILLAFFGDLIIPRPFGPHAIAVILASEFLRGRLEGRNDLSLLLEWALVAATFAALIVFVQLMLSVTGIPLPPPRVMLKWWLLTVMAYPFMVALAALIPNSRGDY
ncbi:hypothetical protein ACMA5I_04745 [Paracoccaceae bacterium GXU_MW_L88]